MKTQASPRLGAYVDILLAAALTGVLIFGEPMNLLTAAGILCVLAGVYILR